MRPAVEPDAPPRTPRIPPLSLARVAPRQADLVLLGVPFDGTSGRRPMQRHGPSLIRAALSELTEPTGEAPTLGVHEAGDVRVEPLCTDALDERTQGAIAAIVEQAPGALPTLLGGEHTISLPAVRALEPASIVSLDAHTDLWRETNGRTIAHSTWLFHAREELGCPVALPLTRTTRGEAEEAVKAPDVHLDLPEDLPEPVYLSIDVDAFDPEQAPAVVFPERGGPDPEDVLTLVEEIAGRYELCGVDLVEINANRIGPTTLWGTAALLTALSASLDP